jgi:hypothetical protein
MSVLTPRLPDLIAISLSAAPNPLVCNTKGILLNLKHLGPKWLCLWNEDEFGKSELSKPHSTFDLDSGLLSSLLASSSSFQRYSHFGPRCFNFGRVFQVWQDTLSGWRRLLPPQE